MLELIGAIIVFAAGYMTHMRWPDLHRRLGRIGRGPG